jgi:membrane-associated phospholipid phosphatase
VLAGLGAVALAGPARAAPERATAVLRDGWRLILELVRHTPTLSPPVASRAFAYLGVAANEALAQGPAGPPGLAGRLNDLGPPPSRAKGAHDEAVVLHATLAAVVADFFANTGPTGQRAMAAMMRRLGVLAADGVAADVAGRSAAHGAAVAAHVLAWAATDGCDPIENMGFPFSHTPGPEPWRWVPTSLIAQQQAPLLPDWGNNRPFALPDAALCPVVPHPPYDPTPGSAFHAQAMTVHETSRALSDEQKLIARFWSDDPMLSPTPAGHWVAIALGVLEGADAARHAQVLALLGAAQADAFIVCWREKFAYDLLRPVTYIRRHIDPEWEPLLITPPFPEYPSGHSTQSAAAAEVLTALFGEDFAFEDRTHVDDGLPARRFPSFRAAAAEAAVSRLYGGIHYPFGNDAGLAQGACVGAWAARLA